MRFMSRAGVVASMAALAVGTVAVPAEAGAPTCTYRYASAEKVRLCVMELSTGNISGEFTYWNYTALSQGVQGTMVVQRCSLTGTNCTTITATPLDLWVYANDAELVMSSSKAAVAGYKYKACASISTTTGWSFTFNCTALHTPFL